MSQRSAGFADGRHDKRTGKPGRAPGVGVSKATAGVGAFMLTGDPLITTVAYCLGDSKQEAQRRSGYKAGHRKG